MVKTSIILHCQLPKGVKIKEIDESDVVQIKHRHSATEDVI